MTNDMKAEIDALPLEEKVRAIVNLIDLGMQCRVRIGRDPEEDGGKLFVQITCRRIDTITKEMGIGYGGKHYPSQHASSNASS